MKLNDSIGGAAFFLLGAGVCAYAPTLNSGKTLIGPGTFPFAVGVLIAIAGAAILLGSFFARKEEAKEERASLFTVRRMLNIGIIPLSVVAYALLAGKTGALFMNFAVVAAVSFVWGGRIRPALIIGILSSVAIYLFFRMALGVPLPSGFIEEMVRSSLLFLRN